MTKWLVCTNITSVMGENERNREQTRLRLIEAGKAEFLEKGYTQACLRDICKRANVTTGAFYFSFANKEALLQAILGPAVEQYQKLMQELYVREAANPETAIENDRMLFEFEYRHKEELILIMEKSEGSCYANFKDTIKEQMKKSFRDYFTEKTGREPKEQLIEILTDMRMQSNLAVLKGNYSMEETLKLAEAIGVYADSGTNSLIEKMKKDAFWM